MKIFSNRELSWIRKSKIDDTLIALDYVKKHEITNIVENTNPTRKYRTIIFIDVIINFALYMAEVLITSKKLTDIQMFDKDIKIVYNIAYEEM